LPWSAVDIRFGSLADIPQCNRHVRFSPESGHWNAPQLSTKHEVLGIAEPHQKMAGVSQELLLCNFMLGIVS
jgi:hypothetical protein